MTPPCERLTHLALQSPPVRLFVFVKSTKDAMKPLRVALEGVLTDANKPYVLMLVVLIAPLLLFAAHRMEEREKRAAKAVEAAAEKKKD